MEVHLVDGTYELFRAYYGAPGALAPDGREVGATRALARSLLSLLRNEGATHVAVAAPVTIATPVTVAAPVTVVKPVTVLAPAKPAVRYTPVVQTYYTPAPTVAPVTYVGF